jgi:hypothetical protein
LSVNAPREMVRGQAAVEEVTSVAEPAGAADFASRAERLLRGALEARR